MSKESIINVSPGGASEAVSNPTPIKASKPIVTPTDQSVLSQVVPNKTKGATTTSTSSEVAKPASTKGYWDISTQPVSEAKPMDIPELQNANAIIKDVKPIPYGDIERMKALLGDASGGLTKQVDIPEVVLQVNHKPHKTNIKLLDTIHRSIENFPFFTVTGMNFKEAQRYQLLQTFDSDFLYLFGDSPVMASFSCAAYDMDNANWFRSLYNFYKTKAAAYVATAAKKVFYLHVNNWLFEGAWLSLTATKDQESNGVVRFQIDMLVSGVSNLSGASEAEVKPRLNAPASRLDQDRLTEMEHMKEVAAASMNTMVGIMSGSAPIAAHMANMVKPDMINTPAQSVFDNLPNQPTKLTDPSVEVLADLTTPKTALSLDDINAYTKRRQSWDRASVAIRDAFGGNLSDHSLTKRVGIPAVLNNIKDLNKDKAKVAYKSLSPDMVPITQKLKNN